MFVCILNHDVKILPLKLSLRLTLEKIDLGQGSMLNAEPGQSETEPTGSAISAPMLWCSSDTRMHTCRPVRLRHGATLHQCGSELMTVVFCKTGPDEWGGRRCTCRPEETSLLPACGLWRLMPLDRQPDAQRNPDVPETSSSVFLPSWPVPNFCILVCSK